MAGDSLHRSPQSSSYGYIQPLVPDQPPILSGPKSFFCAYVRRRCELRMDADNVIVTELN